MLPQGIFLLLRWATRSPPHQSPSVTASPQGEGFGEMSLIWKPSFTKMLSSIFFLENASQIGLSIPEGIAPLPYQRQRSPKPASGSKRAIRPGSRGLAPGPLSPHFSGEMGPPAGQAGPRGAVPQGCFRGTHPQGTYLRRFPAPGPTWRAPGRWSQTEPPTDDSGPGPPGSAGRGPSPRNLARLLDLRKNVERFLCYPQRDKEGWP